MLPSLLNEDTELVAVLVTVMAPVELTVANSVLVVILVAPSDCTVIIDPSA